jgi:hypothetical protein
MITDGKGVTGESNYVISHKLPSSSIRGIFKLKNNNVGMPDWLNILWFF